MCILSTMFKDTKKKILWHASTPDCDCNSFQVSFSNWKKGITQYGIYPKVIHMQDMEQYKIFLGAFPELLTGSLSINGNFKKNKDLDSNALLEFLSDSKVRFDSLQLSDFGDLGTFPSTATTISLIGTSLNRYEIPGVKKMTIKSQSEETETFTFSSDLEDLEIVVSTRLSLILPQNLRKLNINTYILSVDFMSEEMANLEYLRLKLSCIESFEDTKIIAPNLKILELDRCLELSNYDGLQQFQKLRCLVVIEGNYPVSLLNECPFPELETFKYHGDRFPILGGPDNIKLTFPSNLKSLSIECFDFVNAEFNTLVLPTTLKHLHLASISIKDEYLHLGENLQTVHIYTWRLTLESSFRIPHMIEKFTLYTHYLTVESLDFMYHLPNRLVKLHLFAYKQIKRDPFTQKIKWPLVLGELDLRGFRIDHRALELLNLKESRLQHINISGGDVRKLNVDLFPVSVEILILSYLKIHELPESFERLENLRRLSLMRNQLRKIKPVKLPVASLNHLDLFQCNIRLLSPFLVSMYEEKNRNAVLKVFAPGNRNVNVIDARRVMKEFKGLSLALADFDETLKEISKHSSRLECLSHSDPYFDKSEFSGTEEVVSHYDPEDLYNGSEFSSDEEDNGSGNK
ncbi:LPF family protein, putative [Candida dubliniensis CD36]|uniref:LPF family protein, putative n=1 Tax=Candida dubliniensis (strain CD36 / ATCC MYA-646 / CBS 7987 / NCPF 3949 / NRRL Y-17841) TaxID=573826 RepID=B9WIZ4_CANDC|nr:LPF family protein, putative [Candida dubliniensis CD36]CAX41213.1 LPF family protein, putative [Candida dubliniensis CD36]